MMHCVASAQLVIQLTRALSVVSLLSMVHADGPDLPRNASGHNLATSKGYDLLRPSIDNLPGANKGHDLLSLVELVPTGLPQKVNEGRDLRKRYIAEGQNLTVDVNGTEVTVNGVVELLNLTWLGGEWPDVTSLVVRADVSGLSGEGRQLRRLLSLDLSGNRLTEVPAEHLFQLTSLRVLNVSGNRVQTLPNSLEPLFRRLEVVDVSDNPLSCSHELAWLLRVTSLQEPERVTCVGTARGPFGQYDRNPMMAVIRAMQLVNRTCPPGCRCLLRDLLPRRVTADCSRSGRRQLPTQLPAGVIALNVSKNQIVRVSPQLCQLLSDHPNLTTLDLSRNRLLAVDRTSLACADRLGHLDLSYNRLARLELRRLGAAFRRNLHEVFLSHNPWDCRRRTEAVRFRKFLLRHHKCVPDVREVRCRHDTGDATAGKEVYRLPESSAESLPPTLTPLDGLLVAEVALLLMMTAMVTWDVYWYRRAGRLPWLVTCRLCRPR